MGLNAVNSQISKSGTRLLITETKMYQNREMDPIAIESLLPRNVLKLEHFFKFFLKHVIMLIGTHY